MSLTFSNVFKVLSDDFGTGEGREGSDEDILHTLRNFNNNIAAANVEDNNDEDIEFKILPCDRDPEEKDDQRRDGNDEGHIVCSTIGGQPAVEKIGGKRVAKVGRKRGRKIAGKLWRESHNRQLLLDSEEEEEREPEETEGKGDILDIVLKKIDETVGKPEAVIVADSLNKLLDKVVKNVENIEEQQQKQQKTKRKKLYSQRERIERDASKHPILEPCSEKCKLKCRELIPDLRRQVIHDEFWLQNYDDRRQWIRSKVTEVPTKRQREDRKGDIDRKTRIYHLNNQNGEKVTVCQVFFLRTLGFTKDQCVKTALQSAEGVVVPSKDKRGCGQPTNKFSVDIEESVKHHIFKYNPSISHYRRAHAPHRLYISPEFDVKMMHREFIENTENNVSYSYYYNMVKSLNISFVKLGEEECEVCELHANHLKECHSDNVQYVQDEGIPEEYSKYKKKGLLRYLNRP